MRGSKAATYELTPDDLNEIRVAGRGFESLQTRFLIPREYFLPLTAYRVRHDNLLRQQGMGR